MISNDVNVIFAYLDSNHKFHVKSRLFVNNNVRRSYVLLNYVTKTFIKTYKDYINQVGDAIVNQVLIRKNTKTPIKNPSPKHITNLVESEIDKYLKKLSEEYNYTYKSLIEFKKILLTNYSIAQLFFEEKAIGEFREKFIEKGNDFSVEALNKFVHKFNKVRTMKLNQYKEYDKYFSLIKMKDFEDRKICAELFCFGKEIGTISFLTFDKNFRKFLKKHGSTYNVKVEC